MDDNYKPGRAVFLGLVIGAFIGLLTRKLVLGGIIGFCIGLAMDASNKAKRDRFK